MTPVPLTSPVAPNGACKQVQDDPAPAQIAVARALRPEAVSIGLQALDTPVIGRPGLADYFCATAADVSQQF